MDALLTDSAMVAKFQNVVFETVPSREIAPHRIGAGDLPVGSAGGDRPRRQM